MVVISVVAVTSVAVEIVVRELSLAHAFSPWGSVTPMRLSRVMSRASSSSRISPVPTGRVGRIEFDMSAVLSWIRVRYENHRISGRVDALFELIRLPGTGERWYRSVSARSLSDLTGTAADCASSPASQPSRSSPSTRSHLADHDYVGAHRTGTPLSRGSAQRYPCECGPRGPEPAR